MEHLLLPKGVKHFIVVPYGVPNNEWYKPYQRTTYNEWDRPYQIGFLGYPDQRGWTTEDLMGKTSKFNQEGDKSVQDFFQTWLFFGLLIEFLHLAKIEKTTSDFLVRRANSKFEAVNTAKLPGLLKDWVNVVKGDKTTGRWVWKEVQPMLEKATAVLNHFCTPEEEDRPLKEEKTPTWPVRDEISTTMMALLFSLKLAVDHACEDIEDLEGERINFTTGRSKILRKCIERRFCLADASTYMNKMQIDGHYYFAASPSPKPEDLNLHYQCTKEKCLSFVDDHFYVTKHTNDYITSHTEDKWHKHYCTKFPKYGGQHGVTPERGEKSFVDAVCTIIEKPKMIPIALWMTRRRELWATEYHPPEKGKTYWCQQYVAISHV